VSEIINGILDYTEQPEAEVHAKRVKLLWLVAAISLSMTAIGYIVMAIMIF